MSKKEVYEPVKYGANIQINTKKINQVHDINSLIIGVVAGILNLESLIGFGFFFAVTFMMDLVVFTLISSNGNVKNYFQNPVKEIFLDDYSRTIFSFIMMWTLVVCLIST